MHPFFTQSGRLGVYLLGWIPLTAILGGLLMLAGGLSLLEAAALAAPLGSASEAYGTGTSEVAAASSPARKPAGVDGAAS